MFSSSRSQMFFKIGVLENFANFTGKHGVTQRCSAKKMFQLCVISRNSTFSELRATDPVYMHIYCWWLACPIKTLLLHYSTLMNVLPLPSMRVMVCRHATVFRIKFLFFSSKLCWAFFRPSYFMLVTWSLLKSSFITKVTCFKNLSVFTKRTLDDF